MEKQQPEQVEVKRMEKPQLAAPPTLLERFYIALFPVLGGLILDFADFVTMGPIGLYTGLLVGGIIGWLMSGIYGFKKNQRFLLAGVAGLYCMIPGTFFLPIATAVSALARFKDSGKSKNDNPQDRHESK